MPRLEFNQLPMYQQQLYKLLASLIVLAFILGFVWTLLGFSNRDIPEDSKWLPTVIPTGDDANAQFLIVTQKNRWFAATSSKGRGSRQQDPLKVLEGKPESFRLTGLVSSGDKTYALFLPLIASTNSKSLPAIRQLAEGDTLIGEWVIKTISANQVKIQQGDETRILRMYQPSPK